MISDAWFDVRFIVSVQSSSVLNVHASTWLTLRMFGEWSESPGQLCSAYDRIPSACVLEEMMKIGRSWHSVRGAVRIHPPKSHTTLGHDPNTEEPHRANIMSWHCIGGAYKHLCVPTGLLWELKPVSRTTSENDTTRPSSQLTVATVFVKSGHAANTLFLSE